MSLSSAVAFLTVNGRRLAAAAALAILLTSAAMAYVYVSGAPANAPLAANAPSLAKRPRGSTGGPAAGAMPGAPRIQLSTRRLDLGDGEPGETLYGELGVRNVSGLDIEFSVGVSCGCVVPQPSSGQLVPGGEQQVRLGIELPNHANFEKNAVVTLYSKVAGTQEAAREDATCTLLARCPAPFAVEPANVDFGDLRSGTRDTAAREIQVRTIPGKPPVSLAALRADCSADAFRLALLAGQDGAVAVRVSLAPELPFGEYYDSLELRVQGSGYLMRVPLHARIVDSAVVVPARAHARRDSSTAAYKAVTVFVLSRDPAIKVGPVRLLGAPPSVSLKDPGDAPSKQRRLQLYCDSDIPCSQFDLRLAAEGVARELSFKLVVSP